MQLRFKCWQLTSSETQDYKHSFDWHDSVQLVTMLCCKLGIEEFFILQYNLYSIICSPQALAPRFSANFLSSSSTTAAAFSSSNLAASALSSSILFCSLANWSGLLIAMSLGL